MAKPIVAVLVALLFVSVAGEAQEVTAPKLAMSAASLDPIVEKFWDYRTDFLQYSKAFSRTDILETSHADWLEGVAERTADLADATRTLLRVYEHLGSPADRDFTRHAIQHSAQFYSERLDSFIAVTNLALSTTQSPGVAQTAARMKDDLRSLRTSVKLLE
jgi:hypothetical protein